MLASSMRSPPVNPVEDYDEAFISLSESNFSTFFLFALTVPRLVVALSLDELEDPAGHTRLS